MSPTRCALWFSLLALLLVAPSVTAHHYGVHTLTGEGSLQPPGEERFWACVALRPAADQVVDAESESTEGPVRFAPDGSRPDCAEVTGALTLTAPAGHEVRALALSRAPQEASTPGVVRLARQGVAYDIPRASPEAEIGVLLEHGGSEVRLFRASDLVEVGRVTGPGEARFSPSDAEPWTGGVLVVLVSGSAEASALVDWADPGWYRAAPSVGQVAVVVVIALFLMLYHGRSKRQVG